MTSPYFASILASIPPSLEKSILLVLSLHIGSENRIEKHAFYTAVCGLERELAQKKYSTVDRQIRRSIEDLQLKGYPILSDSYYGGYWLGRSREVESYIAELQSRIEHLQDKVSALRRSRSMEASFENKQLNLFER